MANVTGDLEFVKRKEGQSSTSNYIQVNTQKGDALGDTPDAKVLLPQLKKDTSIVFKMDVISIGSLKIPFPKLIKQEIAEPKPTGDKAEYGKIVVRENKAGFLEIRDETPGNVRKIDQHPTGTYDAMLDNGDRLDKTTHKKITMVDDNWEIVVFKDQVEVISGDNKITIKQNRIVDIKTDDDLNVGANQTEKIGSNRTIGVGTDDSLKVGANQGTLIGGKRELTVGGTDTVKVAGKSSEQVGGSKSTQVVGSLSIMVIGPVTISSASKVTITAPKVSISG